MKKLGFYYDMSRCTGCRACQMACKEKNKLAAGDFCRRVDSIEAGEKWVHFSASCNHCSHPACMEVCPTGAMYRAEDGTVQHRDDLCIGCGRCVHHCPYGAAFLDKYTGYSRKCDACAERRKNGQEPACVESCPMRALHFGDLEELRDRFGAEHGAGLPFLPPESMTDPSLMVRGGMREAAPEFPKADTNTSEMPVESRQGTAIRILVLGSGAAAVSAVREIRRRNASAEVTILSREEHLPYSRPMLSKGLTGSFALDRYPILDEAWLRENTVTFVGGVEIVALDVQKHTVTLADHRTFSYDKCIYALGADCFVPPIPGREKGNVFTLRYDRDLHAVRKAMLRANSAAIIGGGITGLELAWELKKSGLEVTVLDVLPRLMDRFLDERSSCLLREAVVQAGIRVETGVTIRAIEGAKQSEQILLEDGRTIPADFVILSTGYRPNIALAAGAGLAAGRAVTVSEKMETSDPDVYACGDCTDRSTATWVQSIRQGMIAGANALGESFAFEAEAEPVMVHTADTSVLMVGDMGKKPDCQYRFVYGRVACEENRLYVNPKKPHHISTHITFCFSGDRLIGVTLVGSLELMLMAQNAVDEQWNLDKLRAETAKRGVEIDEA